MKFFALALSIRWRISLALFLVSLIGIFCSSLIAIAEEKDGKARTQEEVLNLAQLSADAISSIKTAHILFRVSNPSWPLKKGLTPESCSRLLAENDLAESPNRLKELWLALAQDRDQVVDPPWSKFELYREGKKIRSSRLDADGVQDVHVIDIPLSLRWDEANWQLNITPANKERYENQSLQSVFNVNENFNRIRSQSRGVQRTNDTFLFHAESNNSAFEFTLNSSKGCISKVVLLRGGQIVNEKILLGWRYYGNQLWFPSIVAELGFRDGELDRCEFELIDRAIFDKPLPEGVFKLGAPAASTIVDNRNAEEPSFKIHHDIFDVSSNEQLQAARKPLSEELTTDEQAGVTEANQLYRLADGVCLKRIGPHFSLIRKYVSRMLGSCYAERVQESARLIEWDGSRFNHLWANFGGTFSVSDLALQLAHIQSAEIEGDPHLLALKIPGDIVVRKGASIDELLVTLQEIAAFESTVPVKIDFRNVERTIYRATGEFKLSLLEGSKQIEMNGGRHQGHFGEIISTGSVEKLLKDLSVYINRKINNEVASQEKRLVWAKRWYDLPSTKQQDRFLLDPNIVLQKMSDQTGVEFTAEKQTVRILFVEPDKPSEP